MPPPQATAEALGWLERGFRSAKIKLDGADPEGIRRVAAVREAVGDRMALRVDFNESLPMEQAVGFIRQLEPYGLMLVEQPVERSRIADLAEIRRGIRIPLMADESVIGPASLIDIIRKEAADIVKVKVMKQGGLLRTIEMVHIAAAAGLGRGDRAWLRVDLVDDRRGDCRGSLPGGAGRVRGGRPAEDGGRCGRGAGGLDRGVIRITDLPGFGVDIDRRALQRLRRA